MTRPRILAAATISLLVLAGGCVPDPPPPAELPVGTCLDLPMPFDPDIGYEGPRDGTDNVGLWASTDGSCTGTFRFLGTAAFAPDVVAAQALCDARGGPVDRPPTRIETDDSPEPIWICAIPLHFATEDQPTAGECLAHLGSNDDLSYLGGIDELDNLAIHDSTDGSCSGPVRSLATVVWLPVPGPADHLCVDRQQQAGAPDPAWSATQVVALGYAVSGGLWMCNGSQRPVP